MLITPSYIHATSYVRIYCIHSYFHKTLISWISQGIVGFAKYILDNILLNYTNVYVNFVLYAVR